MLFLICGKVFAGEHHDRDIAQIRLALDAVEQLEPAHVRQPQVEHPAIEGLVEQRLQRFAAVPTVVISMSS